MPFPLAMSIALLSFVTTPEKHGAAGDGKADDSRAIQSAVDSCVGGISCQVAFRGSYLSGPIQVASSNVTLQVLGMLAMLPKSKYLASGQQHFTTAATQWEISQIRITGGGTITSTAPLEW